MRDSIDSLQRALSQQPDRIEAYQALVRNLLRRGRVKEATHWVLQLETNVPSSAEGRALAKEVLAHGLVDAQLIAGFGPLDDLAGHLSDNLAGLWQRVDGTDGTAVLAAIRHLARQYAEKREPTAALRFLKAMVLEYRGELNEALATLNSVVEGSRRRGRIAHAMLQKGRILERIRYRDKAQAHYQQALRYDGDNMSAVGALLRMGAELDPAISDRWLEAVARLDGKSPFWRLNKDDFRPTAGR